jgi:hypothetical protein
MTGKDKNEKNEKMKRYPNCNYYSNMLLKTYYYNFRNLDLLLISKGLFNSVIPLIEEK